MINPTYVFCHGLNGCGEYDEQYARRPYWGGAAGDVVARLRAEGYDAHAASVAPQGSAWDRACELYAQLSGTRCDYGKAHSQRYRHSRIGRDFSGQALIPSWDDDTRLVLIGHSFGGATVRLFSELLANGSDEERACTQTRDLSPLFAGGMGRRVRAIVTIAAPSNGTTAYDLTRDPSFDARRVRIPLRYRLLDRVVKSATRIRADGRDPRDWASYDMTLDGAQELNARIALLPQAYYLSVPCDATLPAEDGMRVPDLSLMDPLFVRTSILMGRYSTTTQAGCVVDDAWHANDGLVNTISATAPLGDPQRPLDKDAPEDDKDDIPTGVWNVLPTMRVNHSYFQGGFLLKEDPFPFFRDLMGLLSTLG